MSALPDDVVPAEVSQCDVHGRYYGETCEVCVFQAKRDRNAMAAKLELWGLPKDYQAKSFSNFVVETPPHQSALDLATSFAKGEIRHLLMVGDNGTGKTHLAAGILDHLNNAGEFDCLYVTALRMLRNIRECYGATGAAEQAAFDMFIKPRVLIIDEFDKMAPGDDQKRIISELIRDRYSHGRPLAIIANLTHADVKVRMDASAADRVFEQGKMATFNWPSWRRRKAAC